VLRYAVLPDYLQCKEFVLSICSGLAECCLRPRDGQASAEAVITERPSRPDGQVACGHFMGLQQCVDGASNGQHPAGKIVSAGRDMHRRGGSVGGLDRDDYGTKESWDHGHAPVIQSAMQVAGLTCALTVPSISMARPNDRP